MTESLVATILGWQNLYDEGTWDAERLASEVMHLDVDGEGPPGEIVALRRENAVLRLHALRLAESLTAMVESYDNMPGLGAQAVLYEYERALVGLNHSESPAGGHGGR